MLHEYIGLNKKQIYLLIITRGIMIVLLSDIQLKIKEETVAYIFIFQKCKLVKSKYTSILFLQTDDLKENLNLQYHFSSVLTHGLCYVNRQFQMVVTYKLNKTQLHNNSDLLVLLHLCTIL